MFKRKCCGEPYGNCSHTNPHLAAVDRPEVTANQRVHRDKRTTQRSEASAKTARDVARRRKS